MPVTISDIAKKANVSTATVSRMMNASGYVKEETRERILKAIDTLNYRPNAAAVSLSKQQTNVVGVMVPSIGNPYFAQMIQGISQLADQHHLGVLICDTGENREKELRALDILAQHQVRGILLAPVCDDKYENKQFYWQLESMKVPTVILDREVEGLSLDGIFYDDLQSAIQGTRLLLDKGYKKIAVLYGDQKLRLGRARLEGYKMAMREAGIEIADSYLLDGDFKIETSYDQVKTIMNVSERPEAIFSANNMMTQGAIKALIDLGLEDDVEIFSFDPIEMRECLKVKVNCFDREIQYVGQLAMERLIKRMNGDQSEPLKVILTPKISSDTMKGKK